VDEVRVINASPLITLAKVGRLDLLEVAPRKATYRRRLDRAGYVDEP
jgi:hypothetical protein